MQDDLKAKAIKLYKRGFSCQNIASIVKHDAAIIRDIMKEAGLLKKAGHAWRNR